MDRTELRALTQAISDSIGDLTPSPIVKCTRTLNLALLRYGVVGSLDAPILNEIAPEFPADLQLGGQLLPLSSESHAHYAVRQMRQGHVYLFAKRPIEQELIQTLGLEEYTRIRGVDSSYAKDVLSHDYGGWLLDGYIETNNEGYINARQWCGHNVKVYSFLHSGVISIHDPGGVKELRILFTPTALTRNRIKAILANEDGLRDMLQSFDIGKLLNHPDRPQPDLIPKDRLADIYCEYLASESRQTRRSAGRTGTDMAKPVKVMRDQLFPCPPTANDQWIGPRWLEIRGIREKLAAVETEHRGQGAAMVLHDPIGITQELNNWRNAALEDFKTDYLDQKTTVQIKERHHNQGVRNIELATTNERLVRAASTFESLQKSYGIFKVCADVEPQWDRYKIALKHYEFEEHNWRENIRKAEQGEESYTYYAQKSGSDFDKNSAERYRQQAEHLRAHEPVAVTELRKQAQARFHEVQAALKQADVNRAKYDAGFQSEYAPLINQAKYQKIKNDYQQKWDQAEQHVAPRTQDHLQWLQSDQLLEALAYYEPASSVDDISAELIANAKEFAIQVGICMVGAEGSEDSHQLLMQDWWDASRPERLVPNSNLAARALCFNNTALQQQMREMLNAATLLERYITDTGSDLYSLAPEQRKAVPQFSDYLGEFKKWSRYISKYMGFEKDIRSLERIDDDMAAIYTFSRQVLVKILAVGGSSSIDYGVYRFFRDIFVAPNASPALIERIAVQGLRGSQPLQSFSGINRNEWDAIMKEQNAVASFRLTSFIFAIDAINLLATLSKGVSGEGDLKAIYSAFMTTSGSLINMNAAILEAAVRRRSVYSEASIRFTRLKVVGAAMGAVGAIPLLYSEASQTRSAMVESWRNENWLLYSLYGFRLMTNTYAIAAVLYGVSGALGAYSTAVLDNLYPLAGNGASAAGAATEAAAARTFAARVFKPTTPITVALLILTIGLTTVIELAASMRTLSMRRYLSRMVLRTDDVDLLEVDVVHAAETDEGQTVEITRTVEVFPTLKDEQDGLAVAIRTLTKGVPVEVYEQAMAQETATPSAQQEQA